MPIEEQIPEPPKNGNGNAWKQWAARAVVAVGLSIGGYAMAIQKDLSELKAHHAVEEARWEMVLERLKSLEEKVDRLRER